jgi:hypothetical protein
MERKCSDVLCCLIFLAFFVLMLVLSFYGISKGDPLNILTPFDTKGNRCGMTKGFEDYKYKFFTKLSAQGHSAGLSNPFAAHCVKECPLKGNKTLCKPPSGSCTNSLVDTAP